MDTVFWETSRHQQTLLQQRVDGLRDHYLFLQEMFQGWKDFNELCASREERKAHFAYLQRESLQLRQALQQVQQDLQQERKRLREDRKPFPQQHL